MSETGEIVVCAHGNVEPDRLQPLPAMPADPTVTQRAASLMTLHLGRIEIGTPCDDSGRCWVGLGIKF